MILLSLSHAVSTLRCEYYVSQIHNTLRCTLLVHTGGIDGMWKMSKGAVSASWSTRKDGAVNLILSCFKEFDFGSGDGTMEIAKTSWVSPVTL